MDQKNTLIAIILSALVLIGWQIFIGVPQMEKQKQIAQQQQQTQTPGTTPPAGTQPGTTPPAATPPGTTPPTPAQPSTAPSQPVTRETALAASPRVKIDTPRLRGSIALKGGRVDDLLLTRYHETVDPNSPPIVLL